MTLVRPLQVHPPTSGFHATADRVFGEGPGSSMARPARRYVEGLLRTSDLLLHDAPSTESRLQGLLAAVDVTIPLRALALIEPRVGKVDAATRHTEMTSAELERLEARGHAFCTYFQNLEETLTRQEDGGEILLPVVGAQGDVIAVLVFLANGVGTVADIAFFDAVAGQLAAALEREWRAASMRAALESTATELAMARAAARRLGFLADASAMLSASVDPAEDLGGLARLVSRRIADGCALEIGPLDALRRTAASTLSEEQIDRAARLVSRVFVLRAPLVAVVGGEGAGRGEGWRSDSEAESARSELGLGWLACIPVRPPDGEVEGAALLFGAMGGAPLDASAVEAFARLLGVALVRARPHRAALQALRVR